MHSQHSLRSVLLDKGGVFTFGWLCILASLTTAANSGAMADSTLDDAHWAFVSLNRPPLSPGEA